MILDTHAWLFYFMRKPLSKTALRKMQGGSSAIAAVTLWEVALLIQGNRLRIDGSIKDWLNDAIERTGVRVAPLDPDIAQEAARLTSILRDPVDCQIVGTALCRSAPLLTRDQRILDASKGLGLKVIKA